MPPLWADQTQIDRRLAVETLERRTVMPAASSRSIRAETSTWVGCAMAKADPAGVEVDGAQDLGMRVIGVDDRRATRDDLSKQLGLGPATCSTISMGKP